MAWVRFPLAPAYRQAVAPPRQTAQPRGPGRQGTSRLARRAVLAGPRVAPVAWLWRGPEQTVVAGGRRGGGAGSQGAPRPQPTGRPPQLPPHSPPGPPHRRGARPSRLARRRRAHAPGPAAPCRPWPRLLHRLLQRAVADAWGLARAHSGRRLRSTPCRHAAGVAPPTGAPPAAVGRCRVVPAVGLPPRHLGPARPATPGPARRAAPRLDRLRGAGGRPGAPLGSRAGRPPPLARLPGLSPGWAGAAPASPQPAAGGGAVSHERGAPSRRPPAERPAAGGPAAALCAGLSPEGAARDAAHPARPTSALLPAWRGAAQAGRASAAHRCPGTGREPRALPSPHCSGPDS